MALFQLNHLLLQTLAVAGGGGGGVYSRPLPRHLQALLPPPGRERDGVARGPQSECPPLPSLHSSHCLFWRCRGRTATWRSGCTGSRTHWSPTPSTTSPSSGPTSTDSSNSLPSRPSSHPALAIPTSQPLLLLSNHSSPPFDIISQTVSSPPPSCYCFLRFPIKSRIASSPTLPNFPETRLALL